MSYTILLAEDQKLIRDSLEVLLSKDPMLNVAATASNGNQALKIYSQLNPDLVILDIKMPEKGGLETAAILKKLNKELRIVLLTTFEEGPLLQEALHIGVHGIFLKDIDPDLFILSLKAIMGGLLVFHPAVEEFLGSGPPTVPDADIQSFGLTAKDMDVIRLIAEGCSNKQIAAAEGCSEGTVKNRVSAILSKMGLQDRTQIAVYAIKHNLLVELD